MSTVDQSRFKELHERVILLETSTIKNPLVPQEIIIATAPPVSGRGFNTAIAKVLTETYIRTRDSDLTYHDKPASPGENANFMKISGLIYDSGVADEMVRTRYGIFPKPFAARSVKKAIESARQKTLRLATADPSELI